jgi:hypothetical protein
VALLTCLTPGSLLSSTGEGQGSDGRAFACVELVAELGAVLLGYRLEVGSAMFDHAAIWATGWCCSRSQLGYCRSCSAMSAGLLISSAQSRQRLHPLVGTGRPRLGARGHQGSSLVLDPAPLAGGVKRWACHGSCLLSCSPALIPPPSLRWQ